MWSTSSGAGLQRTEKEEYPFALYGIPDWKQNRRAKTRPGGKAAHLADLRLSPNIVLLYYSLYRIARGYPDMPPLKKPESICHGRAARTADAMFTIPPGAGRLVRISSRAHAMSWQGHFGPLKEEKEWREELRRLWRHWVHLGSAVFRPGMHRQWWIGVLSLRHTGFESTEALWPAGHGAGRGGGTGPISTRRSASAKAPGFSETDALQFGLSWGWACYYWYSSDYRAPTPDTPELYVPDGGWAIWTMPSSSLGSLFSAAAGLSPIKLLVPAQHGPEGRQLHCGSRGEQATASSRYEPQPFSSTWLDQPHHGGPVTIPVKSTGLHGYLRGRDDPGARPPVQDGLLRRTLQQGRDFRPPLGRRKQNDSPMWGRRGRLTCFSLRKADGGALRPGGKELACTVDLRRPEGESARAVSGGSGAFRLVSPAGGSQPWKREEGGAAASLRRGARCGAAFSGCVNLDDTERTNVKMKTVKIDIKQIKVDDGFWNKENPECGGKWVPHQWRVLNDREPGAAPSHAVKNFPKLQPAWRGGEFYGCFSSGRDVASGLKLPPTVLI